MGFFTPSLFHLCESAIICLASKKDAFKCNPRPSFQTPRCRERKSTTWQGGRAAKQQKNFPLRKLRQTPSCPKLVSPGGARISKVPLALARFGRPSLRVFVPPSIRHRFEVEANKCTPNPIAAVTLHCFTKAPYWRLSQQPQSLSKVNRWSLSWFFFLVFSTQ